MRKSILLFAMLVSVTLAAVGQETEQKEVKRDTVQVPFPVYMYDVTDTLKVKILYKRSNRSNRIFQTEGFALVRGFKTMQNGQPLWVDKPQLIGTLDSRKKPIKYPIQVI